MIFARHFSLRRVCAGLAVIVALSSGRANADAESCRVLLAATNEYRSEILTVYKYRTPEMGAGEQYQLALRYPAACRVVPAFSPPDDRNLTALFTLNFGNYQSERRNICADNSGVVENGKVTENVRLLIDGHAWMAVTSKIIPFGPISKSSKDGAMSRYEISDKTQYAMRSVEYFDENGHVDPDHLDRDYLYSDAPNGAFRERFVRCSKDGRYPVAQCQQWLKYGSATLQLRYARAMVGRWQDIEDMVGDFLECAVVDRSDKNKEEGDRCDQKLSTDSEEFETSSELYAQALKRLSILPLKFRNLREAKRLFELSAEMGNGASCEAVRDNSIYYKFAPTVFEDSDIEDVAIWFCALELDREVFFNRYGVELNCDRAD